jgi:hypothetical protein
MRWNEPLPVQLFKDIELPDFSMINYSITTVEKAISSLAPPPFLSIHFTLDDDDRVNW